jgi:signal transduction histidine kinase
MTQLDFKISSGLKNIIGKELIVDDLIAIFELVKNSYDANAKKATIVFENIKPENLKKGSRILIIDDGVGMSLDDITNKWLFIAYSEKRDNETNLDNEGFRDKVQQKRIFAGAKGIGRFSCDRLGSELNLFSKKSHEKLYHKLYTNWKKFEEDTKKEFQTIKVEYKQIEDFSEEELEGIEKFKNGTILEIYSLNSNWDRDKLLKLKKYLQRLINPAQDDQEPDFQIFLQASEFQEEDEKNKSKGDSQIVNAPIKNIIFEKLGIKTTQLNCSIDKTGSKIFTELIDKNEFIFSLEEKNEFAYLKNVNIKLFYLNTEAKKTFHRIMGIHSVQYGSVFLYKNRFRIHPYGDEYDDWLGLERRKSQGMYRFLATRELMGRIEINGNQPGFKEASSRDGGIIKNDCFDDLISFFMSKALRRLEKYVVEGIGWESDKQPPKDPAQVKEDSLRIIKEIVGQVKDTDKKINFNDNLLAIIEKKQVETLPEIIKNIESVKKFVKIPEQIDYIDNQIKAVKSATNILHKDLKEKQTLVKTLQYEVKSAEEENLFLKSVTGEDKNEIIALQHQIGISTSNISHNLKLIRSKIDKNKPISNEELLNITDKIFLETKKISTVIKFVTKATFTLDREETTLNLPLFIKQYVENVYSQVKEVLLSESGLIITVNSEPNFNIKCSIKPLEFAIIIDNLMNNSIKANAKNIILTIKPLNDAGIELIFTDDGKGISQENFKRIFNFGFTTTSGSGIGLYHVKQIVEKLGGEVIANENIKKGAEFRIKLPILKVSE